MEFTFYEILGIKKTASEEEIRSAYKKLAKKYHPDKHAGNPVYEEHFKKINSAYQTLSNSDKRRRYDLKLEYLFQQSTIRTTSHKRSPSPVNHKNHKSKTIDPEQQKKYRMYGLMIIAFVILFIAGVLSFYYYMNKVSAQHHLEEAKKQEERKHYLSALEEYTIAINFDPELYEAYERRGDVRIYLWKDYPGAARDYSKALANPEKNFELYFKRAKAYLKQKEYDKGIQDLDSAIALNSSYDSLYFYRAEVNHFIRHYFDKAIPDYKKTIELNKDFADAWLGKALCLQGMGEYQQSVADFDKLILMNKNQGDIFYYRGFSKLGLRDTSGACSDWFQAERLNFSQARSALNSYCTED